MTEQPRTLSRDRLTRTAGSVSDMCLAAVCNWLGDFLDLGPIAIQTIIGAMRSEVFEYRTGSREQVLDITADCTAFVHGSGDGLLNVFVPHATAGIAILETGAGSDEDLLAALGDLLPADDRWRHRHGSPGHGRSHVLPAFIAPSATVPVVEGRLTLGTWQSICLVDVNIDNPVRQVRLSLLTG